MSMSQIIKPGESTKKEVVLSNLKDALTVVANVADGAIYTPFVKGTAQIVIQIIDAAQKMKSNKKDCLVLAEVAAETTLALNEPLKGLNETDIPQNLKMQVKGFEVKLEEIKKAMTIMSKQKSFKRFLRRVTDSDAIQDWKQYLDRAEKLFDTQTNMDLRLVLDHNKKKLTAIQDTQVRNHIQIMDRLEGVLPPQPHPLQDNHIILSRIPPPKPTVFHGRDNFLTDAVKLILAPEPTRLAILGTGGMGKTSLALSILHHPQVKDHFGDQQYFVPCDSAISPEQLMNCILTVLQVPKVEKEDAYTSLHNFLNRSPALLLVLDNLETPYYSEGSQTAIADILSRIAYIAKVTLVITMRGTIAPDGVQWSRLLIMPPLSLQASKDIFSQINPDVPQSSELQTLLQEMDYMPLAVTLISKLAQSESCTYLLQCWRHEQTRLLKTEAGKAGRLTSIEVSIELSLKSGPVAAVEDTISLLALISYLPNGVYKWMTRLENMAPRFQSIGPAIRALKQAGLVQDHNDSLKVLSPIRLYMCNEHPLSEQHLKQLEKYYIDFISQHDTDKHYQVNDLLYIETGNIISIIKTGCEHNVYSELVQAAYDMSWYLYFNSPTIELLDVIIPRLHMFNIDKSEADCHYLAGLILQAQYKHKDAEQRLCQAEYQYKNERDISKSASCMHSRGEIFMIESRYTYAKDVLEEALSEFTKIGDHAGAAKCLRSLGDKFRMQKKYTDAQLKLQQALDQFTEIGDCLGAAQCLRSLGDNFRMQHKYTDAELKLQQALDQFTEIGNSLGAAQCLRSLGDNFRMQNKYTNAELKLQQALDQFTEIRNSLGAAQCLRSLGNNFRMQNKYTEAELKLHQALDQFTEIGNSLGAAQCLKSLGDKFRMQKKYTDAQLKLQQALDQFTEIGDCLGAAECLQSLGVIFCMQHKYTDAELKLQQALDQSTEIGDHLGAAQCLKSLGDNFCMQNKYTDAELKLQQALDQFTEIGDSLGAAQCLKSLGDKFRMQNKYTEAELKLHQALDQFTEIGKSLGVAQCLKSLGDNFRMQNKYTDAELKLQQALDQFTEIGNSLGAAQCLKSLGDNFRMQNKYTDVELKLQQALDQFTEIGDHLGAAQCLESLGNSFRMQNKHTEAELKLQQALDQFTEIGHCRGAAHCLQSLSDNFRMQNKYTDAELKLQQALDQFTEIGDHLGAAQCLESLGNSFRMQNKYTEAELKLQQALDQFTEIGHCRGAAHCLQSLSDNFRMQNKYTEAELKLQQALDQFKEIGDHLGAARCLESLGNNFCMQNKYTEAESQLQQALH